MRSSSTLVWDIIDNDTDLRAHRVARRCSPGLFRKWFSGIAGESDEAKVSQVEASCTLTTELIYQHPN